MSGDKGSGLRAQHDKRGGQHDHGEQREGKCEVQPAPPGGVRAPGALLAADGAQHGVSVACGEADGGEAIVDGLADGIRLFHRDQPLSCEAVMSSGKSPSWRRSLSCACWSRLVAVAAETPSACAQALRLMS